MSDVLRTLPSRRFCLKSITYVFLLFRLLLHLKWDFLIHKFRFESFLKRIHLTSSFQLFTKSGIPENYYVSNIFDLHYCDLKLNLSDFFKNQLQLKSCPIKVEPTPSEVPLKRFIFVFFFPLSVDKILQVALLIGVSYLFFRPVFLQEIDFSMFFSKTCFLQLSLPNERTNFTIISSFSTIQLHKMFLNLTLMT